MANFGLSKPWIAKLNPATNTYSDAFKCGKAISTAVTPNYNEAPLYADNQQTENVTEFKNANVSIGTDRLPSEAAMVMFGHTVAENGEESSKSKDEAGYIGYGFITAEQLDGVKKYRACVLLKVKMKEGEESFETKGDSIVFKTPSLSGTAIANEEGEWRIKSPYYATEAEADQWIQKKFGVVEQCATPEASVDGGTYTAEQTVTLSCATKGATIKYTTDGTTPSEENGTEYNNTISIAATAGLRAIAYKSGLVNSEVMTKEYFING
ncbi:major tail protein [Waltera acetigignens]|nr:MAG TPA: tail tube protein [Caudoviricetes sp.]